MPFEVKIADLGFARRLDHDSLAATRLGTPLVMAPEVLEGNKYDHSADVWSLGCIFYEMLTGFSPFTGTNQTNLLENIAKGDYKFPKTLKFSLQGLSFLNMCLQYNHELRPSLLELSTHPYIALDEALEERVRLIRLRLEFRVSLSRDKPRVLGELDHLDKLAIRGGT